MKQKILTYALLVGLTLNPAYAGDGINTELDLIKAGAMYMVVAPVVLPVLAVKNLL